MLLTAAVFTGCGSGDKDGAAYRSSSDTSSSEVSSNAADTVIKDTSMKDSANSGPAFGSSQTDVNSKKGTPNH